MNPNSIAIYNYHPDVASVRDIVNVFHRSVHAVPDAIYSKDQKSAWAPDCMNITEWRSRLQSHSVWVALDDKNKECMGFLELDDHGDIECLYVCPRAQRHGIARSLLVTAEEYMRSHFPDKKDWHVQASDFSYEFFLKHGFMPKQRNIVERFGIDLPNTTMTRVHD